MIDEREDALGRLGDDWSGEFYVGQGIDISLLKRAGIDDADAVVVTTDGDNSNIVIGQMAEKSFGVRSVIVRILDPARAEFYRGRGLERRLPDPERDRDAHQCSARRRRRFGLAHVPPDRRRRQSGSNLARALIRSGHEVTLIEQRPSRFDQLEAELEHQVHSGDATEIFVLERAGIKRPPDIVVAVTGDDEDNIVICQLARDGYGVETTIARVNDPRNQPYFDLLGISADRLGDRVDHGPDRARGARARPDPPARARQGEPRDRRDHGRPGRRLRRQADPEVELPDGARVISIAETARPRLPTARCSSSRATQCW